MIGLVQVCRARVIAWRENRKTLRHNKNRPGFTADRAAITCANLCYSGFRFILRTVVLRVECKAVTNATSLIVYI